VSDTTMSPIAASLPITHPKKIPKEFLFTALKPYLCGKF
jgi:hypothetical protein